MKCFCGLDKSFQECCGAIISGEKIALSPEELMRSRYSAYAVADGSYLVKSATKENRYGDDVSLIEEFCKNVKWLKLEVLHAGASIGVEENEINGVVEFKAYYLENTEIVLLHERSDFIKNDGIWEYDKGSFINSKIERNDLCPCGSGLKYKKCKKHLIAY
jgi:SEC-C motif-containing protein